MNQLRDLQRITDDIDEIERAVVKIQKTGRSTTAPNAQEQGPNKSLVIRLPLTAKQSSEAYKIMNPRLRPNDFYQAEKTCKAMRPSTDVREMVIETPREAQPINEENVRPSVSMPSISLSGPVNMIGDGLQKMTAKEKEVKILEARYEKLQHQEAPMIRALENMDEKDAERGAREDELSALRMERAGLKEKWLLLQPTIDE